MKKRQPVVVGVGASVAICLSLCSVFNGWLSSCQVHAGLKVATWLGVSLELRSSNYRGAGARDGIFLIL